MVEVWTLPAHPLCLLDLIDFSVFSEIKDAGGSLGLDSDYFFSIESVDLLITKPLV